MLLVLRRELAWLAAASGDLRDRSAALYLPVHAGDICCHRPIIESWQLLHLFCSNSFCPTSALPPGKGLADATVAVHANNKAMIGFMVFSVWRRDKVLVIERKCAMRTAGG
jgi:hypothetical protein